MVAGSARQFLLDTNICIYIAKKKPPEVLRRFETLDSRQVGLSVITYGELLFGVERSDAKAKALETLQKLTSVIRVLDLPTEAASAYAKIRTGLETAGRPIGNNDLWIAAHARAAGLTVVTNNEREFRRIPGLEVENWVDPR